MNKILSLSLITLATSFAFGAANDTLISFSTPGPDKYQDGTTVLDGESYALVWTKTGATFTGLAADGKVVDSENSAVLVYAPVAKAGRCPTVVFELDADLASKYADGTFGVYLLDTRLANGSVGGVNANGLPVAVNGYGKVDGKGEQNGSDSFADLSSASDASSVAVTTKSALPADAPKPRITAIRIVGNNVHLTVKGTLPCLKYAANEVKMKGESGQSNDSAVQPSTPGLQPAVTQGAASTGEEITLIVPKSGNSGFFTVGRE